MLNHSWARCLSPLVQSQKSERCLQGAVCPFASEVQSILTLSVPYACHTQRPVWGHRAFRMTPCALAMSTTLLAAGGLQGDDGCDKGDSSVNSWGLAGFSGVRDVLPSGIGSEWQGSGWTGGSWALLLGLQGLQAWQRDTCSSRMPQHHVKEQQTTCLGTGLHAS